MTAKAGRSTCRGRRPQSRLLALTFIAIEGPALPRSTIAAVLATGAVAALAFLVIERRAGTAALVPLDLFRHRDFSASTAAGLALMGAGLLALSLVNATTSFWAIEAAFLAIGIGLGLNGGLVMAVAVAAVPASRAGTASGVGNTARVVGATLAVAVLGAVFAHFAGQTAASGTASPTGPVGLLDGMRWAMLGGAVAEFLGAVIVLVFLGRAMLRARSDEAAVGKLDVARSLTKDSLP